MKKNILSIVLLFASLLSFAQNGTVKRKVLLEPFTALKVSGASDVELIKGDDYIVVVEAPARVQEKISVKVQGETLVISYKNIRLKNNENLTFYITAPTLSKLDASGASDVKDTGGILSGDKLLIVASGAADVHLNVDYKTIKAQVSGAATVKLSGKVNYQAVNASGAADYIAKDLVSDTSKIVASGASSVYVNVLKKIDYKTTGAANVKFKGNPEEWNFDTSKNGEHLIITSPDSNTAVSTSKTRVTVSSPDNYDDTTNVKVGSIDVEVVDGDTVTVRIGGHRLRVSDDGDVEWEKVKRPRFNGHWGGVELGINGYVTPDFNTNWGSKYDYLNLKYERSVTLNLNLWEQNIAFNKNRTVGMITGLGLSWNNYFFSNDTYLKNEPSEVKGYYITDVSVRKTKLTGMYITVPVLFEFQTGNPNNLRRFHFTIGGVGSVRVTSHTKIYFNEADRVYYLKDPETGLLSEPYRTPDRESRNIVKNYNSFYQSPFRFDARVGIGYGWLNVFATYGINNFFQSGRGPELHPWTIGITIVGW